MTKPVISTFTQMSELIIQKYERYLPTAFDESMTLLQKVNKVIEYLNQTGELVNDVVTQWNTVMEWVMGDGLSEEVQVKIDEMVADGTFDTIINQTIFNDLNTKIDNVLDEVIRPFQFPRITPENNDDGRLTRMVDEAFATGKPIELNGLTFTIGKFTIEKDNVTIFGKDANFIQQANYGDSVIYDGAIQIKSKGVSIFDVLVNGNQWNYTDKKNQYGIYVTGDNTFLFNIEIINTISTALYVMANKCDFININAHDCSGSGLQTRQSSYLTFTSCHFDRNGFGFKQVFLKPNQVVTGLAGFGVAVRYRSHHVTFIGCTANDNGRDGMNVNQGSHDVAFIGCQTLRNNDGGFTIASDTDGPGIPGNGEAVYNVTYDESCESANNWNSGLAIFHPAYNILIKGKYYNNHRLAGHKDNTQSSYYNGIFIPANCKNIHIDAECYDDRQSATVTEIISSGVLGVSAWATGTYENYPKVAIYGSDGTFKGYAKITSETNNSVSISVEGMSYSPVTISSIAVGDTITQAVQKYGAFFTSPSTGILNVRGFGNSDRLLYTNVSSTPPYGGEYKLVNTVTDYVNHLVNGDFESDTASISNGWAYYNGGGYAETVQTKSNVSMKYTLNLDGVAYANASLKKGIKPFIGNWIQFKGWAYSLSNKTALRIVYDFGSVSPIAETKHSGKGWEYLELWAYIPEGATNIRPRIHMEGLANDVFYWDELQLISHMLKQGKRSPIPYLPE